MFSSSSLIYELPKIFFLLYTGTSRIDCCTYTPSITNYKCPRLILHCNSLFRTDKGK
jgi:hypothetical protein